MSKLSPEDLGEIYGRDADVCEDESLALAAKMLGPKSGTLSLIMGNLDVAHVVMANLDLGTCHLIDPVVIDHGQTISFTDMNAVDEEAKYEIEVRWMLEQPDAVVWEKY